MSTEKFGPPSWESNDAFLSPSERERINSKVANNIWHQPSTAIRGEADNMTSYKDQ